MLKLTIQQDTLRRANEEFAALRDQYTKLLDDLRKKYDRDSGCVLDTDIEWQCPPMPPKPVE